MTVLIVYCVFIAAASWAGGHAPSLIRLTHARMQMFVSLVAGFMLGIALFHMLPHASREAESLDWSINFTIFGLLMTFFLIRAFHFHQHGSAEEDTGHEHDHPHDHDHDHAHDHDEPSQGAHPHTSPEHPPRLSKTWMGMGLGMGIHSLLDGVAVAASVQSDAHGAPDGLWLGIGTALAVLLHKPLDSMSIVTLMAAGGWPRASQRWVNLGYALICPLGAALFWFGADWLSGGGRLFVGGALAFSAGMFLCISLGDLLPEVQFHSHDRLKLSLCLIAGVLLAWSLRFVEPAHMHSGSQLREASRGSP